MAKIKAGGAKQGRRQFLKTVAAGGAAVAATALAAPNVSRAQTVTLRFQTTWGAKDIFNEYANDYAKRVNEMAGSRLRLEVLPAGAVVGAFRVMDAVHDGSLDGAHGVTVYWYNKNRAASLFGTTAPFGWDANQLLGWFYHGGGQALYNELIHDIMKLNVVGFLTGPMPTQPLGWFKKEIKGPKDLENMKYRTVGLSAVLFSEMGLAVTQMPGGEIVPAIDRGLLDGAEFNNPSSDRLLGFPDVSKVHMVGSYHQRVESFEILFNKTKFDALPAELRAILRYAVESASADMSWKQQDRYPKDFEEIKKAGVKVFKTPDSVLQAQLKAWDKVLADLNKDPFAAKVIKSQKDWVRRVVSFYQEYDTPIEMGYKHFFPAGRA